MHCWRIGALHFAASVAVFAAQSGTVEAQASAASPDPVTGPARARSEFRAEIVRGRVLTDSGTPLAGAQVIVTMAGPSRIVQRTVAARDGTWFLRFADGTGDYLVFAATQGRQSVRRRVSRGRDGHPAPGSADSVFVVELALPRVAAPTLSRVVVNAKRTPPPRRDPQGEPPPPEVGSAEHAVDGVAGALAPDRVGEIAALATLTPTVLSTPDGISTLGLPGSQTTLTLGGLSFAGGTLPRDLAITTRVISSAYDPAIGWFGASQIAVDIAPGNPFSFRRAHLTGSGPALQAGGPATRALGGETKLLLASVGADGAWRDDRWVYSAGAQMSDQSRDASTFLGASPAALEAVGLVPDSASAIAKALSRIGALPRAPMPAVARVRQASAALRIDRPLVDFRTYTPARRTYGVTLYGSWHETLGMGLTPTATSSFGGSSSQHALGAQAIYSAYATEGNALLELRTGLATGVAKQTPHARLPSGQVIAGSSPTDNVTPESSSQVPSSVLQLVSFGGNGNIDSRRETLTWDGQAEVRLIPNGTSKHRVTITSATRFDDARVIPSLNRYGSFTYLSPADLARNQPALFSRTVDAPARHASLWSGFLAIGDVWRPSPRFQAGYGVRLETSQSVHLARSRPTDVAPAWRGRTSLPQTIGVSPRLGFTWVRTNRDQSYRYSSLGAFRAAAITTLRGGVGEFRSLLRPDVLLPMSGQAVGARRIDCLGVAIPDARWAEWQDALAPIPSACSTDRPGASASSSTDTSRSLAFISPDYRAPRSWRANLAWSSTRARISYGVEGIVSYNLNQPSFIDQNFAGGTHGVTAPERRPLYVSPDEIRSESGLTHGISARRDPRYRDVRLNTSDLRSLARQATITVAPAAPAFGHWFTSAAYTIARVSEQQRGFGGVTAGDPLARTWIRSSLDVRHRVLLQGGYTHHGVTVTAFSRIQSGFPFTPIAGADLNGDGYQNDQAYVPAAIDTLDALSGQRTDFGSLLRNSAPAVRSCLQRSLGQIAPANGCRGPWSAQLNANVSVAGERLRLTRRARIGLSLENVLAAADRGINGSALRGWGAAYVPDRVLYQVTGFDQVARQFRTRINPRFGMPRTDLASVRAPFRAVLDVALDIGRPLPEQQIAMLLKPGRGRSTGPRLNVDAIKRRYVRTVPDPYLLVLLQRDSLLLSEGQVAALTAAAHRYRLRADSAWSQLASHLAGLGDPFDAAAALRRQEATVDAMWELTRIDAQAHLPEILSPVQRRLAPRLVQLLLTSSDAIKLRSYSSGP